MFIWDINDHNYLNAEISFSCMEQILLNNELSADFTCEKGSSHALTSNVSLKLLEHEILSSPRNYRRAAPARQTDIRSPTKKGGEPICR